MTLTPEQLDHLTAESAEDGATMILCSELRELVAAYKRLAEIESVWGVKTPETWADIDPSERPRF